MNSSINAYLALFRFRGWREHRVSTNIFYILLVSAYDSNQEGIKKTLLDTYDTPHPHYPNYRQVSDKITIFDIIFKTFIADMALKDLGS